MHGDRSISVGGNATGSSFITGDHNTMQPAVVPPSAALVDIGAELAQIRAILAGLGGEHAGKIGRALDDAAEEAAKPEPDKDQVGSALGRALEYANKATGVAETVEKLGPHVTKAVGWLGENWFKLLPLVRLVV